MALFDSAIFDSAVFDTGSGGSVNGTATPVGVSATASVGTAAAKGNANNAVTGVSATANVGTASASGGSVVNGTATPSGVSGIASVGSAEFPRDGIELLGGGPGGKKSYLDDKTSYWYKLLSSPTQQKLEKLEPEIAQVIEEKASAVVDKQYTQAQAQKQVKQALDTLGFEYKQAYKRIYLELVAEMQQAQEDDQIAHIVAMLI